MGINRYYVINDFLSFLRGQNDILSICLGFTAVNHLKTLIIHLLIKFMVGFKSIIGLMKDLGLSKTGS